MPAESAPSTLGETGSLAFLSRYPAPVEWAFERAASGHLTPVQPGMFSVRSQDLTPKYYDAGMFSVFPASRVLQSQGAGDDMSFVGYVMPAHRVTDIDDEAFLAVAGGVDLAFELLELIPIHPRDVDVAEATLGDFLDALAVV